MEGSEAYLIPNFYSKSTVVTRNFEVDILDIHIRTEEGKRVNALLMKEEYVFSFKVKFNFAALDVGIAIPFKTEKGLLLTHHNLHGNFIKKVSKGTLLSVDCRFRCIFTPGVYYATIALGAAGDEGERILLSRIVDAVAFKVQ